MDGVVPERRDASSPLQRRTEVDLRLLNPEGDAMTCPNCKCQKCRKASKVELNAVLARRIVARETVSRPEEEEILRAFRLLPNYRPRVSNTVAEREGR